MYNVCCAWSVCIEKESWLGAWFWERGEGKTFLVPFDVLWVVCVCWFEELGEDGGFEAVICILRAGICWIVPKGSWEGNVDFLESPVGNAGDSFEKSVWKWRGEGGCVAF